MTNNNFAKLKFDDQGVQYLEYAPIAITIPGKGVVAHPSKHDYLNINYKEVIKLTLPEKEGFYQAFDHYEETATEIRVFYRYIQNPPVYRHWTPLSVKRAAEKTTPPENSNTFWTLLRQVLVEMNYLEDFWGSQYIAEDDEAYKFVYAKACDKFGKNIIDAFIDTIPVEA